MNLTLGTLAELKAHLLNASLQSATDYDGAIAQLGKGVAGRFEKYCSRLFRRAVADTFACSANRMRLVLPRLPLESVSKIEVRDDVTTGWVDQGAVPSVLFNQREESGLLEFAGMLGGSYSRLRVTYTGGFWLDETGDGSVNERKSSQRDRVALTAGIESLAVVFDDAFDQSPSVIPTIEAPAAGMVISCAPSAITSSGFTALFGFPIPATGYYLNWNASTSVEETVDTSQPAGSTAVPDDLKYAWLLQCEAVWQLRDKLGLSLGQNEETKRQLTLGNLQLVPEVQAVLDHFRRFTID